MSKKIKAVKKVLLLIVVLIILVIIMIYSFSNQMLKAGIEKAATKSLNVGVAIDDVDLSILGGKVEVEKIVVDNPIKIARITPIKKTHAPTEFSRDFITIFLFN